MDLIVYLNINYSAQGILQEPAQLLDLGLQGIRLASNTGPTIALAIQTDHSLPNMTV